MTLDDHEHESVYASPIPYDEVRVGAAAVYCSDGRLGEHFDDFLQGALGLPHYDRLAVPGGAACLAGHFGSYREEQALVAQLEFLIEVHRLRAVVLLAHRECAYYLQRLQVSHINLADRQRRDLATAAARVRDLDPQLVIQAFLAHQVGPSVSFEQVV